MNPQLLMIPTAARIVEETEETAPPPARQIQWAPMAFSEQESVCPATRPHSTRTARLQSSRCSVSSRVRRLVPLSTHMHARTPHTRARARACTHTRARTHVHTNTHVHTHVHTHRQTRAASVAAYSVDSPRSQKEKWEEILEKSWIKLRPHASVPIAEETAASDEVTPSADKTIGKIKAPTISKQISKPVC